MAAPLKIPPYAVCHHRGARVASRRCPIRLRSGQAPGAPMVAYSIGGIFNGATHLCYYAGVHKAINPFIIMC